MKIVKTQFDHPELTTSAASPIVEPYVEDQPGFGFQVAWNTPNLLKPFFVVWFWRYRIQFGWLVDGEI